MARLQRRFVVSIPALQSVANVLPLLLFPFLIFIITTHLQDFLS